MLCYTCIESLHYYFISIISSPIIEVVVKEAYWTNIVESVIIFIIIVKKDWQCKAGRGRLPPYQSEDPSLTLPTYRGKEEKGKIVEDKKVESN